jgi:hypothetical protein
MTTDLSAPRHLSFVRMVTTSETQLRLDERRKYAIPPVWFENRSLELADLFDEARSGNCLIIVLGFFDTTNAKFTHLLGFDQKGYSLVRLFLAAEIHCSTDLRQCFLLLFLSIMSKIINQNKLTLLTTLRETCYFHETVHSQLGSALLNVKERLPIPGHWSRSPTHSKFLRKQVWRAAKGISEPSLNMLVRKTGRRRE